MGEVRTAEAASWDADLAQQLVSRSSQGVFAIDSAGRCTFVNAACLQLLRLGSEARALGADAHQLMHHSRVDGSPYPPEECPILIACREGRTHHVDDDVFWRGDGSSVPVEYWSYPVYREGALAGCVIAVDEVSERRQAERRLADQAAQLAELARFPEMNPGPVLRMHLDGSIILANAAARDVFGDTLIGRCWQDVCPAIDDATWQRILEGAGVVYAEARVGERDFLFAHRRDVNGSLVFVFGGDVSKQKEAERMLAEVARFPEMNPGPVVRTHLDGSIILANAAARTVFGSDLVGQRWRELLPQIDDAFWQRALQGSEPAYFEARIGERDYVFAHRRDHDGMLVFIFGADVTQQKQAERALRQTEKMATLGTLAAGVAHELNNPAAAARRSADQLQAALARVLDVNLKLATADISPAGRRILEQLDADAPGQAQEPGAALQSALARSDMEGAVEEWLDEHDIDNAWELAPQLAARRIDVAALDEIAGAISRESLQTALESLAATHAARTLVREIGEAASRISELVGALKSYSYLGQAPVQDVDVHEGIENTLVILRYKLKRGIEVRREYCSVMPRIPAYGSELNQVWTNLLDNAVDAMSGSGTITIRTRTERQHAVVEIEDDGPGIPDGIQSRIFDPFFTTKAPGKGTGLGLSTTFAIITEKHQGTIDVQSRPGLTRFTVRLPLNG